MKVLVIGYGSIGKRHIKNLTKLPNLELFVVTNRTTDSFLKKSNCKIFKTIEDAIQVKPSFAIICNVTSLHIKSSLLLAKSGIHLFIEKPLSNSLNHINDLLFECEKQKLITQIGCNLRFHPSIKKVKELLLKKKLGEIISIQIENGSYLPDWHPDEDYKKSYASKEKLGGGVILTCIHEIDYLYWFFGNILEVFSFSGNYGNLDIDSEDISSILMKITQTSIAEIHLDYFQQPTVRGGKIIGTLGTVIWNIEENTVKLYNNKTKKWANVLKLINYNSNQMYLDELTHFIDCVKNKKFTINPIFNGIQTLKIALAIKKSSKFKRVIKL